MDNRGKETRPNLIKKLINMVLGQESSSRVLPGSSRNIKRHYKILNLLGDGGFANTYLCQERKTGVKYACKIINRRDIRIELIQGEVNALRSLPSHRNIVGFKDVFEDGDKFYIILDLCGGRELADHINGYLDENDAKWVIRSLVQAVQWCHIHGIMHRDIKPENIMFNIKPDDIMFKRDKTLKLIDFGLSAMFKPGQKFSALRGTPLYMAPEVFLGNYGPEADIWSIGVVLYRILGGHLPFSASGNFEMEKNMILHDEINFNRRPWSKVSREAQNLIKGMMERNVRKRLTIRQILDHPWLTNGGRASVSRTERPQEESYSYRTTRGC